MQNLAPAFGREYASGLMPTAKSKGTAKKTRKPMGRPPKYKPEYCAAIVSYFDVEPYREREVVTINKKTGDETITYEDVANDLPTLAGFARQINVCRDTLDEWQKQYPDFSDAVKRAKAIQEDIAVTNTMKSLYNSTFSIFFAKNNLGYKDRTEADVKLSGSVGLSTLYDAPVEG